ncbi:MAG TPA: hypothetical protein DCK95_12795 [Anaerolineaceae bacterium]|uniref:Lipoprotein n=1 Tax=Anaerolinea thermophila TaxID=167964 RepID=A0A101FXJ1_9CHLR|nr:MAG: hypothetical protein XD73_0923 [Anaerolinea thermophila]HAF63184.1 hypothetical protein [Anaerolineaceae bacterium]
MIGKNMKPAIAILFFTCILLLSACALSEFESGLGEFFEGILPALANAWDETVQYFEGVAIGFENMLKGMLAGLSGIGQGLRNMFRGFPIR